jgi:hypothetical protein
MSTRTLLLSAWYLPMRVVGWQDAVKLVYLDNVDVLVEYDEVIRSPSIAWKMPAVVRLKRAVPNRAIGVKFDLTFDHIVPRSRGGRKSFTNIVTACRPCNTRKGHRTCDQAGMFPLREPYHPKALPLAATIAAEHDAPDEWMPYLGPYATT